ncbi:hypothetical protein V8F20_009617 [Naviculisporaceae sp. PSN 640]
MPGAIARPKRSAARGKTSSAKLPAANAINNFTRVSKLQNTGKDVLAKSAPTSSIEVVLTSKKRKADDDEQVTPSIHKSTPKKLRRDRAPVPEPAPRPVEAFAAAAIPTRKRKTVTFAEPEPAVTTLRQTILTPSRLSRKRQLESDQNARPSTPSADPAEAEALFERLKIQSSPVRKRTKTFTPEKPSQDEYDLPQELLDLLDLQVAFLKTLTMEFAHNGTNSPVDLRNLTPSVTRSWGKRKVTLDDIRRCIGILAFTSTTQAPFFLADYGRGKICIEFQPNAEPGPLREQKLNMDFEANLRTLWRGRRQGDIQTALPLFIATLPKAPVKAAEAAKSMPILGGKSQRTLEELKNGVIRKPAPSQEEAQKTAPPALNPDGTKMSLLDRIRQKELVQSQAALTGPTAAELQRRAALQRADDVAAVIGMLSAATASAGQARIAFTMPALMVKLKDSLRSPISSEDGIECVRLLAKEIAPSWLRIVTVGGRENVVVQMGFQPSRGEVEQKVQSLLG